MSCRIFFTGIISVPKGTKIPDKYKYYIASEPHAELFTREKDYDAYYVMASVSSCMGEGESLKKHFIKMAEELKAFRMWGMITDDRNPKDCLDWKGKEE